MCYYKHSYLWQSRNTAYKQPHHNWWMYWRMCLKFAWWPWNWKCSISTSSEYSHPHCPRLSRIGNRNHISSSPFFRLRVRCMRSFRILKLWKSDLRKMSCGCCHFACWMCTQSSGQSSRNAYVIYKFVHQKISF